MRTTIVGRTGDQNINAVLDGIRRVGTVTFSFTTAAAQCGGNAYDTTFDPDGGGRLPAVTYNEANGFITLNTLQRDAASMALAAIEQFANLDLDWNFAAPGAADIITDFDPGQAQLGMFDVHGLDAVGELPIADLTGGARIAFVGGGTILLAGVLAADVAAGSVLL